jgi:microcystin-dependent protein
MTSYCRRPANFAAHERPTIGDTKFSFTAFNHLGWLKCNGAVLNKSEHGLLYNVIGDTFNDGTEASTQFRLPDPQGRVIGAVGSHFDSNSGILSTFVRKTGDDIGAELHRLNIDQMPSHKHGDVDVTGDNNGNGRTTVDGLHNHTVTDPGHDHGYITQTGDQIVFPGIGEEAADQADNNASTTKSFTGITLVSTGTHFHSISTTGGSNFHNNMQPTLFYGNMFIYCGKVNEGSFPYTTNTDLF